MFHVGSARSALHNWVFANQAGGTFVLRIEDTDAARNAPEWTEGILSALDWIGISADSYEGPYFVRGGGAAGADPDHRTGGDRVLCGLSVPARADRGRGGLGQGDEGRRGVADGRDRRVRGGGLGGESLKAALEAVGAERGLKLGKTQAPVRVAVTGRSVGLPLFESLEVLGRDRGLARLRAARDRVNS